jgi:hypothetical protein
MSGADVVCVGENRSLDGDWCWEGFLAFDALREGSYFHIQAAARILPLVCLQRSIQDIRS